MVIIILVDLIFDQPPPDTHHHHNQKKKKWPHFFKLLSEESFCNILFSCFVLLLIQYLANVLFFLLFLSMLLSAGSANSSCRLSSSWRRTDLIKGLPPPGNCLCLLAPYSLTTILPNNKSHQVLISAMSFLPHTLSDKEKRNDKTWLRKKIK